MRLFLVDGIGPFFRDYPHRRINWSKIPFDHLEKDGRLDAERGRQVSRDFRIFLKRAADVGFNAVTLDDVAHLVESADYPDEVNARIREYRDFYGGLFETATACGLEPFLTSDVMFFHNSQPVTPHGAAERLAVAIDHVLESFPRLGGIILRMGECDAPDVTSDFKSQLVLRKPSQVRACIHKLLPVFRRHDRLLIFRTWTVGAYPVGDLQWNRNTFDQCFAGVEDSHFAISMKYGETDFYRYLPLNKLFFRSAHQKIVELQARREYEGFGEYPSFVGWDYEQYLRQLEGASNMLGAWVWAQTGGWSGFRRLTYLDDNALWNEINVWVTLRIARHGERTEQAVRAYCEQELKHADSQKLLELLRLSDDVIKELLYVDQVARRKLFFRRVRVPPLLSVFWDRIIVNHSVRKFLRCLVDDPEEAIVQGYAALRKIDAMRALAADLGLPVSDITFQYDTFELLAAAREYYLAEFSDEIATRLYRLKRQYQQRYRQRYSVRLDFAAWSMPSTRLKRILGFWLRRQRGYRLIDRILMIRLLSLLSPLLLLKRHRGNREFLHSQAMGIDTVLR